LLSHFFTLGSSYYRSPEFEREKRKRGSAFKPISRFGIGVLSAFMIGDVLKVQTCNPGSIRGDSGRRDLRVDSRFGLGFSTEHDPGEQGTTVRVRLLERDGSHAKGRLIELCHYIKNNVHRPSVEIEIDLPPEHLKISPGAFMSLKPWAR